MKVLSKKIMRENGKKKNKKKGSGREENGKCRKGVLISWVMAGGWRQDLDGKKMFHALSLKITVTAVKY